MAISLKQLIEFYVELADQFVIQARPGRWEALPRDQADLFEWFETFTGSRRDGERIFRAYNIDFSQGLVQHTLDHIGSQPHNVEPGDIASFVLLYSSDSQGAPIIEKCEIFINVATKSNGSPIFSDVERRFFIVKEAMHCLLFLNFEQKFPAEAYPVTNDDMTMLRLLEELAHLSPALWEISQDVHSPNLEIEIAAELLAAILMYPPNQIQDDLNALRRAAEENGTALSLQPVTHLALRYDLPEHLIKNILLWDGIEVNFLRLYDRILTLKRS